MSESARQPERPDTGGPGPLLALAAGGLGLISYICSFFQGLPVLSTTAIMPLLLGGGLLAAATVLPKAGRLLAPAAVAVVVGLLTLVQVVFAGDSRVSVMAIVVVVLAVLQAGAVGAALMYDVGMLAAATRRLGWPASRRRQARRPSGPAPGYPQRAPAAKAAPAGGRVRAATATRSSHLRRRRATEPRRRVTATASRPTTPVSPAADTPATRHPASLLAGQPHPRHGHDPADAAPDTPPDAARAWGQPGPGDAPGSADRIDDDVQPVVDDQVHPASRTCPATRRLSATADAEGRPTADHDRP